MSASLSFRYGGGDGIRGAKIVVVAREIGPARVVNRSGRHKAQQAIARDDAEAWIERKLSHVPDRQTSGA